MFPNTERDIDTPTARRASSLAVILRFVLVFTSGSLIAHPVQAQPFPFQGGPGNNPEKMFELMFGADRPEEEEALKAVKISFTDERAFGQKILDAYLAELKLKKLPVVRKGRDVEYLQSLVATIHPLMTNAKRYQHITIYVVHSDEVDARAIAGGHLFFTRGLLNFARSEAALVGVVGHELSHLDREHLLVPLKRTKILQKTQFAPAGNFDPEKFMQSGTTLMRIMGRPFRPEDEAAADRDGAQWAYKAGYDPREIANLFERLHLKNQDQKVPLGNFFRTHPYNEDRCAAIHAQFETLQKDDSIEAQLYIGRQNLKKRIPKSAQEFPE